MPTIPNTTATRKTHPYVFYCDRHPWCFYRIAVKSNARFITRETAHECPRPIDKRIGAPVVASILSKLWDQLDEFYDEFQTKVGEEKTRAGYVMRGMAIAMTPFMNPYFKSADEIVREVVRRAEHRRTGADPRTPGIGAFTPPPGTALRASVTTGSPAGSGRAARTATPAKSKFTTDEIDKIRQAHAAGFDMNMLTTAFDCTEAEIKSVLN